MSTKTKTNTTNKNKLVTIKRTKLIKLQQDASKVTPRKIKRKFNPKKVNMRNRSRTALNKNNKSLRSAYAMCRLFPFGEHGPASGIPDGSETRRLLVDHRMMNTFTFGSSGTFNIAITPILPSSIWFNTTTVDTTWKLNGASYPALPHNFVVFLPIHQPEWRSLGISYYAQSGRNNNVQTLYNSSKYRIVSVGWAITFVGNITNSSGMITVSTNKFSLQSPLGNSAPFTVFNADGSTSNIGANQILQRGLQGPVGFQAGLNKESKMFSFVQGAHGILKHSTADFKYVDLSSDVTYPSWTNVDTQSALYGYTNNPTDVGSSAVICGMDDDWHTTLISITGGNAGASFVLDTIYCIEYVPSPVSNVYALAQPAPKANTAAIVQTAEAARNMPIGQAGAPDTMSTVVGGAANMLAGVVKSVIL